jgi:(2Fe-2S) ferredoxin
MWECVDVKAHLFVCVNERPEGDVLGTGCGPRGDAVYARFKEEVAKRGLVRSVWVTRTFCLGVCPQEGCTVVTSGGRVSRDVVVADVEKLLADAQDDGLGPIEELQRDKVLALARRLKPGLTLEDVQNPHDFPELDDCDWHYEDGVLTGIQTVRAALRAR